MNDRHEVRIHLDQKPLHSPTPTTGFDLYKLGGLPPGYKLYRQATGDEENKFIPNDRQEIHLKEDEHFYGTPAIEEYKLIVNKQPKEWPKRFITGAEIKTLAGSPADWVVNQSVPGPTDPEIGNEQRVDLSQDAPPPGVKRFTTRKPTTSPGQ